MDRTPFDPEQRAAAVRERMAPRWSDPAYLHLRDLKAVLIETLARRDPAHESSVLDVFSGTSPYRELFGAHYVGFDIDTMFGRPHVIGGVALPFRAGSFDLVVMTQALYLLDDDRGAVAEMGRVLRPGGWLVVSNPIRFRPEGLPVERRYRPGDVESLFGDGWAEIASTYTGSAGTGLALNVNGALRGLALRIPSTERAVQFAHVAINAAGALLDAAGSRSGRFVPATEVLCARRAPA